MAEKDRSQLAYSLYAATYCPFCLRVMRAIEELGLEERVEWRNTLEPAHREALREATGRSMIPCLRIDNVETGESEWMFESADIVAYLKGVAG